MNDISDELKDIKVRHRGEGGWYRREDLVQMEPACLRALFRERIHHSIEVNIYPVLMGKKELPPRFGLQPQLILEVWKERGFSDDGDDFAWGKKYLEIAAKMRAGESVDIDESLPEPFNDDEMAVVRKLIWDRRSVRDWIPGKKVPDEMIEKILEAGRAAPNGCNLSTTRFVVIKNQREANWVWSDIPTPMDSCILIIVCYDKRIFQTTGQDIMVPHNQLLDAACAGDHMCLMAHALGLGAVWLTCTKKTADNFKKKYGIPDYIEQAFHIAVGWCAKGSLKSKRMPLSEMIITRESSDSIG